MNEVLTILNLKLVESNSVFVFPSEITAEFWKKRSLLLSTVRAVREDRFISWDKFKEKAFSLSQSKTPVNQHIRTLFTESLLEENSKGEPVFKSIIFPEYAHNSLKFRGFVKGILPRLKAFEDLLDKYSNARDVITEDLIYDLSLLKKRYSDFLEKYNLFEPSYENPDMDSLDKDYYLFFPEVIADFREFEISIKGSKKVEIVPSEATRISDITVFRNSREEFRWMFNKIGELLDSGCSVNDIAVTVPSLDERAEIIRKESSLYGIPVNIRQGQVLSKYPAGRIFRSLYEAENSGYSIASLKDLFLCRSYPWKNEDMGRELISFGIKYYCIQNHFRNGKFIDLWKHNFKKSGNTGLEKYFAHLTRSIRKLTTAKTFKELKTEIQSFVKIFLDTSLWDDNLRDESSRKVFQFSLDCLNDLAEAEKMVKEMKVPSPYNIWLSALDEKLYVEKNKTPGISVYPYRVSAGITPVYHFIPGASQDKVRVEVIDFPFLREDQRQSLGGADDEFSDPFIDLYCRSGETVFFSCSREDFSGPQLLPGRFISSGKTLNFSGSEELRKKDIIFSEPEFWFERQEIPEKIYPVQKRGLNWICNSLFFKRESDMIKTRIPEIEVKLELSDIHTISPTSLESFINCPYAWFLSKKVRLDDDDYEMSFSDSRLIGVLFHSILAVLFKDISDSGGLFQAEQLPDYRLLLEKHINSIFEYQEKNEPAFISPVMEALRETVSEKLNRFLEIEVKEFSGYEIRSIEKDFSLQMESDITLKGRIDRVSGKDDNLLIVDYKKRNHTGKSALTSHEDIPPLSFQIPFYLYLLNGETGKNVSAAYYDIERGKYFHVISGENKKAWFTAEEADGLIYSLKNAVRQMVKGIKEQNFPANGRDCTFCSYRSICRTKYLVR